MQQVTVIFRDGERRVYGEWRTALRAAWWDFLFTEAVEELYRLAWLPVGR